MDKIDASQRLLNKLVANGLIMGLILKYRLGFLGVLVVPLLSTARSIMTTIPRVGGLQNFYSVFSNPLVDTTILDVELPF